jgi:serine/threonine protein kinase
MEGMEPDWEGSQWKRVCELASHLLDSPAAERDALLAQKCGEDAELRARVLEVCRNYSEADDFFGAPLISPLVAASEDSLIGHRIGPWKILRILGEGGMGRIYLVERADGVFTQLAALKVIRENSGPAAMRRFHTERRILAMLEHPSIARAIDGGTTASGAPFLVMEYVQDGQPIDEFCKHSPVADRIRLFLHVVEAVEAAHKFQVAHLDLKPANILVTSGGLPKVLDFGIAKLFEKEGPSPDLTEVGSTALTPSYASPEQLLRERSSFSSDIYSLGAVLYKIVTGHAPHNLTGLNFLDSIRLVTESEPLPASAKTKEANVELDAILVKALERSPARRYGSATEFAADLRRYLEGVPVHARKRTLSVRARRFLRWHRGVAVAAAACLMLLVGVGTRVLLDWRAENQRLEGLRNTAGSVISEYQSQLTKLSGNSALLDRIASDEKRYLDSVRADASKDPDLRRLVASAYGSVAVYQTADKFAAQDSLLRSMSLWREVLKGEASSSERLEMAKAARLLGKSQISMGKLTEAGHTLEEGERLLDSLSADSGGEAAKLERVMMLLERSRLGAWAGNGPRAIGNAQKAVAMHEKLPSRPLDPSSIAITRMQLADSADVHGSGNPELVQEILRQTRMAVKLVREAPPCPEMSCRTVKAFVLNRAPAILIHHGLVQEALSLRDGVDLAEAILDEDPGNESARFSLRIGLFNLGLGLERAGRLEECLRVRRRMVEVSTVSGRDPGPPEDRLNEAMACGEVGRILLDLDRLGEARGYLERAAEILANPPNKNVAWLLRQADAYGNLGVLDERTGKHDAARAHFAKASAAAENYLAKTGTTWAKAIEAGAHYQQGRALMGVDKAAGCSLLRRSFDRYRELTQNAGHIDKHWELNVRAATKAARGCS